MNKKLAKRSICAFGLGGWIGLASALSIGPLSGSTAIGRPLAVTAPIQFQEPPLGNSAGCVSAEVLYGDQRLDSSRVQIDLQPDATRQVTWARITSAAVVDEPFVTLVLQAGCGRATSRRFVVLADAPRQEVSVTGAMSALVPRREPAAAAPGPQRPGLQLAVWDPNAQPLPWLRASAELKSQPQDLRTADRLPGLEAELGSLRRLADGHRSELLSARETLQSAQRQRHLNLLMAIVLASLAGSAAAFFWHRRRHTAARAASADSWYAPPEPTNEGNDVVQEEPRAAVGEPVTARAAEAGVVYREAVPMAQPRAPGATATPFEPVLAESPGPLAPVAFHDRVLRKVDALNGAQQQAEFFASLGQIGEAVSVLKAYLEESGEQPVIVYLELFRIYHGTGMRIEYEALQGTFRQAFGIDVPSFGQYVDESRELDLYVVPVDRIAAAWPSERSQDIIEELLFQRPATSRDLLSLDAYRDLLWLFSLGQEVVHNTGAPAGLQLRGNRALSDSHHLLPWAVGESGDPPELSLDSLSTIEVAPALNAFAIDIDLGSLRVEPSGPAALTPTTQGPAPPPEIARPVPAATPDFDAFDAVMESQSRRHDR